MLSRRRRALNAFINIHCLHTIDPICIRLKTIWPIYDTFDCGVHCSSVMVTLRSSDFGVTFQCESLNRQESRLSVLVEAVWSVVCSLIIADMMRHPIRHCYSGELFIIVHSMSRHSDMPLVCFFRNRPCIEGAHCLSLRVRRASIASVGRLQNETWFLKKKFVCY